MKPELIAELERINDKYPFQPFELETLDGRRIKVTRSFQKLYGKEEGDLVTRGKSVQILKYAELKDSIDLIPAWRRPLSWLYDHPFWLALAMLVVVLSMFIIVIYAVPTNQLPVPVRVPRPLVITTETVNGNVLTTIRSGDFFTRIIKTDEQSFVEEGYVNAWGEYHVTDIAGVPHN